MQNNINNYINKNLLKQVKSFKCAKFTYLVIGFQYYDEQFPSAKEQKTFEKNLFNKTHRANGMLALFVV